MMKSRYRLKKKQLKAMVDGPGAENSSYAIVEIMQDGNMVVTGYRKAVSQDLSKV